MKDRRSYSMSPKSFFGLSFFGFLFWAFIGCLVATTPLYQAGVIASKKDAFTIAVICNFFIILTVFWYRKELIDRISQRSYHAEKIVLALEELELRTLNGIWLAVITWILGGIGWLLLLISRPFRGLPLFRGIGPETCYVLSMAIPTSVVIAVICWILAKRISPDKLAPKHD